MSFLGDLDEARGVDVEPGGVMDLIIKGEYAEAAKKFLKNLGEQRPKSGAGRRERGRSRTRRFV